MYLNDENRIFLHPFLLHNRYSSFHTTQWNFQEIAAILISFQRHAEWQSREVKVRPRSGSMLLYSRKKVRYRRDGYCWKKRKDGKTTREDHMKLKVGCLTNVNEVANVFTLKGLFPNPPMRRFKESNAYTVATYTRPSCQHFTEDVTGCCKIPTLSWSII